MTQRKHPLEFSSHVLPALLNRFRVKMRFSIGQIGWFAKRTIWEAIGRHTYPGLKEMHDEASRFWTVLIAPS